MQKYKFDLFKYPFQIRLEELFKVYDLSTLNESISVIKRENDQATKYHALYYEWARTPDFTSLYTNFIKDVIKPIYKETIVYQTIPTFRIAYPKNKAVGEWHKDKAYRNGEWAASVKEDNWFFPMTDAFDTNTIWVESAEDRGDYKPMNCRYGEIIQWDGCNLMHGNKINDTGKARVSVDFRVIRKSNYIPSNHGSINVGSKFKIGEYYSIM